VGQLRGSISLTRMMMCSVELYRTIPGWVECGGIRLASSRERMEELRRQAGWAKTFGLPLELISAQEAQELFPLMSTDGVLGAALLPSEGYLDPAQLTRELLERAVAGGARHHLDARDRDRERARAGAARADRARRPRVRGGGDRGAACSRPSSGGWRVCGSRSSRCRTSTS
jgi:glycine/D-amino acid oxidase-like deaminating enzyme